MVVQARAYKIPGGLSKSLNIKMTTHRPDISAWEGHVWPGRVDPRIRRKWVTNIPYGPPIKDRVITNPSKQQPLQHGKPPQGTSAGQPHPIGDETHVNMMQKMQSMMKVGQNVKQKVPSYRDWR